MKTRILSVSLVAVLFAGLLGGVATAGVHGAGVFQGVAEVGNWFFSTCDKEGLGDPAGRGLYAPLFAPADRNELGTYSLTTGFDALAVPAGSTQPGLFTGTFDVCGWITTALPGTGIGGSCGTSKGFDGHGRATGFDADARKLDLKVFDISWKQAAGGVLPVTASYEEYDNSGTKTGKRGTIAVLVAVFPVGTTVANCFDSTSDGVQQFTTVGAFTLFQPYAPLGKGGGHLFPRGPEKRCLENGPDNKTGPKPNEGPCPGPGAGK